MSTSPKIKSRTNFRKHKNGIQPRYKPNSPVYFRLSTRSLVNSKDFTEKPFKRLGILQRGHSNDNWEFHVYDIATGETHLVHDFDLVPVFPSSY